MRRIIVFIETSNTASLASVAKLGAVPVGRIGFVEVFGIRFHYLLGRDALRATKPRLYFERM